MAFEISGNMYGAPPVINTFQVSADCYVGQMLECDAGGFGAGGHCGPMNAAAAGPDTATNILGICIAVRDATPTYNSTYQGDFADYDTSQADQVANDPKGPCEIDVAVLRPGDLVKAPIAFTTVGTAPTVLTASGASTTGLAVAHTGTVLAEMTDDDLATIYCRTGANRGQYRVVTTGATATQTVTIAFTYDVAIGDTFVAVQLVKGLCHFDLGSQMQAWLGNAALTNYYVGYCHQLNLEEAGREWAIISPHPNHLWY